MITKEIFLQFVCLQNSGKYNIITDKWQIIDILNITEVKYNDILKNYSYYYSKYVQETID